jgi:hypothetical protein
MSDRDASLNLHHAAMGALMPEFFDLSCARCRLLAEAAPWESARRSDA